MQTIRTFIAVEISPALQKRAAELIELLRASQADVKWVDPGNLHLTLKFLGDVPNVEVPDVCRAVEQACREAASFPASVLGAGAFPDAVRPRTVWIGVRQGTDEFVALHDRLDAELADIGFPPERRRFHPHLTIGRLRRGGQEQRRLSELIQEHSEFEVGMLAVDELVVFSSSLDRSGPSYDPLAHVPLMS